MLRSSFDSNVEWKYQWPHQDAMTHVVGFRDAPQRVVFPIEFDLMSYCGGPYATDGSGGYRNPGVWVSKTHYDRLVHFAHGLLLLQPMCELVKRWMPISGVRAIVVAGAFLAVLSTVYELIEWLIAVVMDPEAAERYNGQQGDLFDAQKDMALALLGTWLAGLALAWAVQQRAARVIG